MFIFIRGQNFDKIISVIFWLFHGLNNLVMLEEERENIDSRNFERLEYQINHEQNIGKSYAKKYSN